MGSPVAKTFPKIVGKRPRTCALVLKTGANEAKLRTPEKPTGGNKGCYFDGDRRSTELADKRDVQLTRRGFCYTAALATAGAACLPQVATGQAAGGEQPSLAYPPRKIEGAERVLPGSFLYFSYPKSNDPAVLLRTLDGQYLAYSRRCAHLGCTIDFDKAQRCLACPCHRGVYDARTGYVLYGPPPRPLDQIILQVRAGGEIWAVGKAFAGDQNAALNTRPDPGGSK